jgi:hypothetical protein
LLLSVAGIQKSVQVHPTVLKFLGKQWETLVGGSTCTLDCYTKFLHKDGVIFWAHPKYQDEGPWYNWAMVCFEEGDFPCHILLFYKKMEDTSASTISEDTDIDGRSDNQRSIHVIVQAMTSHGEVLLQADRTRWNKMRESNLCTRWLLDTNRTRDGTNYP